MSECNENCPWEFIGEDTGGDIYWCTKCGAIAEGYTDLRDMSLQTLSITNIRKPENESL